MDMGGAELSVPGEVELENVIDACEFFGLDVDPNSIVLLDADVAINTRANLFLQAREMLHLSLRCAASNASMQPSNRLTANRPQYRRLLAM